MLFSILRDCVLHSFAFFVLLYLPTSDLVHGPNSTEVVNFNSFKKSDKAESAVLRMRRLTSDNMLNKPSKKVGNHTNMSMSGTASNAVIQFANNWRTCGFVFVIYFFNNGINFSTWNVGVSVLVILKKEKKQMKRLNNKREIKTKKKKKTS